MTSEQRMGQHILNDIRREALQAMMKRHGLDYDKAGEDGRQDTGDDQALCQRRNENTGESYQRNEHKAQRLSCRQAQAYKI